MNIQNTIKSILAGMSISIAAVAYFSVENAVVGGLLFSVGLLTIYLFEWNLYTGKCCFILENQKKNLLIAFNALFGNLLGTFLTGWAIRGSGLSIIEKAVKTVDVKLAHTSMESFILAIFCGIMMSIAVLGYKKQKDDFGRFIIIALPITVFIIAKFEHVVANMFYISLANKWSLDTLIFIFICAAGNMLGCLVIPFTNRIIK